MMKTYKFRLYPSKSVEKKMQSFLGGCRSLYNSQLEYEKNLYFDKKSYANRTDLNNLIPDWKAVNPNLNHVYGQVLQNVSDRVHKSFINFFRRVKKEEKVGFPRFKNINKYNSFTYPQYGFNLEKNKIKLAKIGYVNIRLHREIKGKIKTLTIIKTLSNKWFACFNVEKDNTSIIKNIPNKEIGIDVGLNHFYVDSEGNKINNPRYLIKSEKKLALLQRKHSKRELGGKNKTKSRLKVAKLYEKIKNQRLDFLHKLSRRLINNYSNIAIEQLNINNMVKRNPYLAKSINDASWNKFLQLISYKVEETGGRLVAVNSKNTSQYCICGNKVKKSLATRIHKCNECGLKMDRDLMSAIIIKNMAFNNYTIGTMGINACGDVSIETSMNQETAKNVAEVHLNIRFVSYYNEEKGYVKNGSK